MKHVRWSSGAILGVVAAVACGVAAGSARAAVVAEPCPGLHRLGFLSSGNESGATGISADGAVVVGTSGSKNGPRAFLWTKDELMTGLGDLAFGKSESGARAVSADGTTVVGYGSSADGQEPFVWSKGKGMVGLGYDYVLGKVKGKGRPPAVATGVSGDGLVVVGYLRATAASAGEFENAFVWTRSGGLICLELDKDRSDIGRAGAVSADGRTVVGASLGSAFLWTKDKGVERIGGLPGGDMSAATGVSADGSVVVGETVGGDGRQAWIWTRADGFKALGDLPGGKVDARALAVSPDGTVVVGTSDSEAGPQAFVWDAAAGMRPLGDLLRKTHGVDLGAFVLLSADAVTADAAKIAIVGQGKGPYPKKPKGKLEAYLAVLPRAAP